MTELTQHKVRNLSAADLGHEVEEAEPPPDVGAVGVAPEPLPAEDLILEQVVELLKHYGGVIFTGPPGTSKSYYAERVGITLVSGQADRLRFVQFHPSYQYEDFVEGFVPQDDGSGFKLAKKHLLDMCKIARDDPDTPAVLVIDELSRGEPGRIFGEALTYVEKSKRDHKFHLSSGREVSIPPNLIFLATMNPLDRGVDEVDAAFERRFAKIAMEPDAAILADFLTKAGMSEADRDRVVTFFRTANGKSKLNPFAALGHTFFQGAKDLEDLRRIWNHQLQFLYEKAFRIDPDGLADIERAWNRVLEVKEPEEEEIGEAEEVGGDEDVAPPPEPT